MPPNIQIGLLVLGGILILIAILGGNFKLFGAEVATTISNVPLRTVAFVIGTALIIITIQSTSDINPVAISPAIDNLSETELEKRQIELEKRFQELEERASQSPRDPEPQTINLTGTWYGQNGLSYQIFQNGNSVTIQEINPLYGVTAVGQGQIQGQSVVINYQTASYTQGVANLTISPEGRSLNGTFRDNYSGYTVQATLSR